MLQIFVHFAKRSKFFFHKAFFKYRKNPDPSISNYYISNSLQTTNLPINLHFNQTIKWLRLGLIYCSSITFETDPADPDPPLPVPLEPGGDGAVGGHDIGQLRLPTRHQAIQPAVC